MRARKFSVILLRHHPNRDNIQVFLNSLEEFQYQDCRIHDSQEVCHAPSESLVKLRYYENKIFHFLRAALLKHWANSLIFYWCKIWIIYFITLIKEMSLLWHKSRRSVNWCQLTDVIQLLLRELVDCKIATTMLVTDVGSMLVSSLRCRHCVTNISTFSSTLSRQHHAVINNTLAPTRYQTYQKLVKR